MFESYLENKTNSAESGFEPKLRMFIGEIVESDKDDSKSHRSSLKKQLWHQLSETLLSKFEVDEPLLLEDQLEQAAQHLNTTKQFSALFAPFWKQFRAASKSNNLLSLIQTLFAKYLNKFATILTRPEFAEPQHVTCLVEKLAFVYSNTLNVLTKSFLDVSLIKLFLEADYDAKKIDSTNLDNCISSMIDIVYKRHHNLKRFIPETSIAEGFLKNSLIFSLIDFYLIINPEFVSDLIEKLDFYLIKSDQDIERLDEVFNYYLASNTTQSPLFEWFIKSERFFFFFLLKADLILSQSYGCQSIKFQMLIKLINSLLNFKTDDECLAALQQKRIDQLYQYLVQTVFKLLETVLIKNMNLEIEGTDSYLESFMAFTSRLLFNVKNNRSIASFCGRF